MGEEKGSSIVWSQRQWNTVETFSIDHGAAAGPSLIVYCPWDAVDIGGGCQHIGDQGFAPTAHSYIDLPGIIGTPVPVEGVLTALPVPGPVHAIPDLVDRSAQSDLLRVGRTIEILAGAQQSLQQVGCLYDIAAVIL